MPVGLAEMHREVGIGAVEVKFILGTAPKKRELKLAESKNLAPRTETSI